MYDFEWNWLCTTEKPIEYCFYVNTFRQRLCAVYETTRTRINKNRPHETGTRLRLIGSGLWASAVRRWVVWNCGVRTGPFRTVLLRSRSPQAEPYRRGYWPTARRWRRQQRRHYGTTSISLSMVIIAAHHRMDRNREIIYYFIIY